ncbi:hypothetical protein CNYM01_06604, partial [Colletotrichum nymphaeae SA-01]
GDTSSNREQRIEEDSGRREEGRALFSEGTGSELRLLVSHLGDAAAAAAACCTHLRFRAGMVMLLLPQKGPSSSCSTDQPERQTPSSKADRRPTCAAPVCLVPCLDLPPNPDSSTHAYVHARARAPSPSRESLSLSRLLRSRLSSLPVRWSSRLSPFLSPQSPACTPRQSTRSSPSHPPVLHPSIHLGLPPLSPGLVSCLWA